MGIPETIVAAGIAGTATVTAALFQLYTALRVKSGQSPRKTSIVRSSFVTTALMIASATCGYVYAEFRQQQALEGARAMHDELRAMRDEINAQLLVLAQTTGRLARDRDADSDRHIDEVPAPAPSPANDECDETGGNDQTPCEAAGPPETSTRTPLADGIEL